MKQKRRAHRRRAALILLGAVCVIAVTAVTTQHYSRASEAADFSMLPADDFVAVSTSSTTSTTIPLSSSTSTTTTSSSTTTTMYVHAIPHPVRIQIPTIDVNARIVSVGLLDDGNMEVPEFGLAGWYKLGSAPGAAGPSVIVAHVDSTKGPDVFYRLKDLEPGDEVLVYNENGDVATFVVDSKEQQLKSELPADRIWNDTWEPVIRLITCGGDFDRASRHYLSNVIVYGHLTR